MILDYLREYAKTDRIAATQYAYNQNLKYSELWDNSEKIAGYFLSKRREKGLDKRPIAIIGHKDVDMLVCFISAIKSGAAYCPIDIYAPPDRINTIIETIRPQFVVVPERNVLLPEGIDFCGSEVIDSIRLKEIVNSELAEIKEEDYLQPDDLLYILFTSGSTGKPKGVQVMLKNMESEAAWICGFGPELSYAENATTHINQAPFTFDLSMMDLFPTLRAGRRLWMIEKPTTTDYTRLMESLKNSGASTFESTPSFVEMCMADPTFNQDLMPNLKTFLMCGEVLTNQTARAMIDRFGAEVYNTYGPTETIAVTGINVTKEILEKYNPLPIGYAKEGNRIEIRGEENEIVILGDTVGAGYFKNPEKTNEKFAEEVYKGIKTRSYKTGDSGWIDENGLVFFKGRIDTQIKLNGYRIELEDIESNITKIPYITRAVVVPKINNGKVTSLIAKVMVEDSSYKEMSKLTFSRAAKSDLLQFVPDYMIPKSFVIVDEILMTPNGKVDRKKMAE